LDKAGKQYWDKAWKTNGIGGEANPRQTGLANYVNHQFHEFFCEVFLNLNTQGKALLEIGCSRSVWLPYFAKEFGFKVHGIDYSEIGCQQAIRILANEGVKGEIVCSDFFSPPESMLGAFDAVISFGVVEHFQNTAECIAALSKFLKLGGLLITSVPNLRGLNGLIQKALNRAIFDIHVALNVHNLAHAHKVNGLQIISCNYFLFVNLGILNLENLKGGLLYKASHLRSWINEVLWILERGVPALKPNRWSSPYINCVAIKRQD
jgi:2-polyprenyl-3-methyl-5-hydroxy-6-metoxy-1,4-benzoquinol methylase